MTCVRITGECAKFAKDDRIDTGAHGTDGEIATCCRERPMRPATEFVRACTETGATHGDYNGRGPFPAGGVTAHTQYTYSELTGWVLQPIDRHSVTPFRQPLDRTPTHGYVFLKSTHRWSVCHNAMYTF